LCAGECEWCELDTHERSDTLTFSHSCIQTFLGHARSFPQPVLTFHMPFVCCALLSSSVCSNEFGDLAFPKGGWEHGETVEQSGVRETEEEAGVRAVALASCTLPDTCFLLGSLLSVMTVACALSIRIWRCGERGEDSLFCLPVWKFRRVVCLRLGLWQEFGFSWFVHLSITQASDGSAVYVLTLCRRGVERIHGTWRAA
jgi:8-oxo-dGTP pyrophosphatase MutT (NUDIX family)